MQLTHNLSLNLHSLYVHLHFGSITELNLSYFLVSNPYTLRPSCILRDRTAPHICFQSSQCQVVSSGSPTEASTVHPVIWDCVMKSIGQSVLHNKTHRVTCKGTITSFLCNDKSFLIKRYQYQMQPQRRANTLDVSLYFQKAKLSQEARSVFTSPWIVYHLNLACVDSLITFDMPWKFNEGYMKRGKFN